ncbi:MAG: YIP1 family protein [Pseudomonadota bacterium]
MSVANDIVATYRGPGKVVSRLLALGPREDRAVAILMGACALMFVAQLPRLSRDAHLVGGDLNMMIGGALMGWIFVAPLVFYLIAWISHVVLKIFGSAAGSWSSRIVLFWALLAATPFFLLLGLVQGFIGDGVQATVIAACWAIAFLWFWIVGLLRVKGLKTS